MDGGVIEVEQFAGSVPAACDTFQIQGVPSTTTSQFRAQINPSHTASIGGVSTVGKNEAALHRYTQDKKRKINASNNWIWRRFERPF